MTAVSAGDPYDNAQNIRNPFGKIFRIDVDGQGSRPYEIPEDNPFAQSSQPQIGPEDPAAYHPGALARDLGIRPPQPVAVPVRPRDR